MLTSPKFAGNTRLQAAAQNRPPLKAPEQGEAVRLLQEALASLGYSFPQSRIGGRFDGIYGNETTQRVVQFQRSQGLMVDGAAGMDTLRRLDSLLRGQGGAAQQTGSGAGPGGAMQPVSGGGTQSAPGGAPSFGNTTGSEPDPNIPPDALRLSSALVCPHGGIAYGSPIPGTDLVSGLGSGWVAGCPFVLGPNLEGRCAKVQWTGADYQRMVNGHPTVRRAGAGLCVDKDGLPTGPVIVAGG